MVPGDLVAVPVDELELSDPFVADAQAGFAAVDVMDVDDAG